MPQTEGPVVAAIPGGGWLAEYRNDDGSPFTSPIVAWLVYADGNVTPVDAGADGWVDTVTDALNFVRLIPPPACPAPLKEN